MTNKEKNKHIEQPDDFSLRVKEKLDDFSMPVDLDIWANIAPHITPQAAPPRNKKWITWVSSAAAIAAIVTVVFLILPSKEPISTIAESHSNEQNIVSPEKETRETFAEDQQSKPVEKPTTTVVHSQRAIVADNIASATNEKKDEGENNNTQSVALLSDNESRLPLVAENDDSENENKESKEKESIEEPKEDVTTPTKEFNTSQQEEPKLLVPKKSQSNDNWLLAASMSSSSGISSGMDMSSALKATNYDPEFLSDKNKEPITLTDPGNANTNRLVTEDFTNIDHETPLSFGVTVRKDLNDRIGIETGLVYTYLSSKMERTNVPQYKAKQELHYLGVPLNVVVYLWNNPKWNVYVSGGGMIEKGLSQKYTQEMFQGNDLASSNTDKGSIDGVQLSLNASAGVSYAFYQNLSLYVEPRYSYYLDNDQPFSIRTDKRNVFGVGGGLRIKF
ncbi:porin family protein [Dysgonomonas sp. Marseille-P4361]|uniref:porin family protein n=1 Tax=Dysgonomonas sp. Marseille-P4361 TaxID=2161820 RepID=UPI000D561DD7|nr:porin family protein [Dysgonomonas sp. Marseille-P4361]